MSSAAVDEEIAEMVEHLFPEFLTDWPGEAWDWDGRMGCPISVIRGSAQDAVLRRMRDVLNIELDGANPTPVPRACLSIIRENGGLRSGQRAFFDVRADGKIRYALWWPWGDPAVASVRIGLQ